MKSFGKNIAITKLLSYRTKRTLAIRYLPERKERVETAVCLSNLCCFIEKLLIESSINSITNRYCNYERSA
jgi:hypothetical protein